MLFFAAACSYASLKPGLYFSGAPTNGRGVFGLGTKANFFWERWIVPWTPWIGAIKDRGSPQASARLKLLQAQDSNGGWAGCGHVGLLVDALDMTRIFPLVGAKIQ